MSILFGILTTAMVAGGIGILGTLGGFFAATFVRTRGGERIYISQWQIHYRGRNEGGMPVDVAPGDAEFVQFFFTADFFNTRGEPTGLRDIAVEFVAGGQTRLTVTPADATSLRVEAMREDISEVEVINLAPRQWSHWKFRRNVWGEEVANVINAEQVFLAATDPDGKRQRHLIADLPRRGMVF